MSKSHHSFEILRMSVRYQVAVQSGKEACKFCYPTEHVDLWDEANGGEGDLKFVAHPGSALALQTHLFFLKIVTGLLIVVV